MTERSPEVRRLDHFLWCVRLRRTREACASFIREGAVRVNTQPTDKPDARVRVGDVLTLPWQGEIRVLRVVALPDRRGNAEMARTCCEIIT